MEAAALAGKLAQRTENVAKTVLIKTATTRTTAGAKRNAATINVPYMAAKTPHMTIPLLEVVAVVKNVRLTTATVTLMALAITAEQRIRRLVVTEVYTL